MYRYYVLFCIALFSLKVNCEQIDNYGSDDVHRKMVRPLLHHERTKRQIITTKYEEGLHHSEVTILIDTEEDQLVLDLRLNRDLISGDHVIGYQKDGETILYKPSLEELNICQYSGKVRGKESSWVALSTCDGVRGIIHDGKQMRYIEPAEGGNINSKHYIYQKSDVNNTFSYDFDEELNVTQDINLTEKYNDKETKWNTIARHKRESKMNTEKLFREPFGANRYSRYLELVLVADISIYNSYDKNINKVHSYLIQTANIVHALFAPLNIYIALVGVIVWNEKDEIKLERNNIITTEKFLRYRKEKILHMIPNDNAQLITNFRFEDSRTGDGFLRSICSEDYSGGVNVNMQALGSILAHTIGHNFGLMHDGPYCMCEGDSCIMSQILTNPSPTHWSYCSFIELAKLFRLGVDYCLRNKPKSLYSNDCGNGFVDIGEQCDCGVDMWSPACTKCCDPKTCKLLANATCAVGECCDTLTCQPKKIGALCREARKECDLPEYCNGYSEHCPQDVYKMDTTPCSNDRAYCVNGECSSRANQCRILWGPSSKMANKVCYSTHNKFGDVYCGYEDRRSIQLDKHKCSAEDAMCGLLYCELESNTTAYKSDVKPELAIDLKYAYEKYSSEKIPCVSTTRLKKGLWDVQLGLVPDGAKCGKDKMCSKQKCVSVAPIRENITKLESSICPSNCSGHGVCNSKGHCHCDLGFSPPYCENTIVGGSLDSGPVFLQSLEYSQKEHFQPLTLFEQGEENILITETKQNKGAMKSFSLLTIVLTLIYYLFKCDVIT